jgi:hypothetical protein
MKTTQQHRNICSSGYAVSIAKVHQKNSQNNFCNEKIYNKKTNTSPIPDARQTYINNKYNYFNSKV